MIYILIELQEWLIVLCWGKNFTLKCHVLSLMNFNELKHERSIWDREYCKVMTLVFSLGQKNMNLATCPTHKSFLTYGHPRDQGKVGRWSLSVMTELHAWSQTQASRVVPESCLSVLRVGQKFCSVCRFPQKHNLRNVITAQWYQIVDNTATVLWIIMLITTCYWTEMFQMSQLGFLNLHLLHN